MLRFAAFFFLLMTTVPSGRDIIVVGQQPWDTLLGSNCKDLAREFSRHNRVLYVNAPLDRNTVLKSRHTPAVQQRLRVVRGQEPVGLRLRAHDALVEIGVETIDLTPEQALRLGRAQRHPAVAPDEEEAARSAVEEGRRDRAPV